VVTSHPIQYQAPLFRELARRPELELTVLFCDKAGLRPTRDPGFGKTVSWDIPLLDGYRHRFLRNWSPWPAPARATGLVNPGVFAAVRRGGYDAVLFHGYTHVTTWIGLASSFLAGIPVIMRTESNLLYPRPWWKRFLKRLVLTPLFRRVGAFVPIGAKNAEYYEHYGVPREKMFRSPYCVDNERFMREGRLTPEERRAMRVRLGLHADRAVFLFVGKLVPWKRPADALAAFDIAGLDGKASLLFVGEGTERPALEKCARERGLGSVAFTGFVNQRELPRYYAAADVMVLPSSLEPWGLVVNEAMACGLKVLASDAVSAAYDLLVDPECGEVFPAGDRRKLAEAMRRAVNHLGARESRMRAVGGHSLDAAANGISAALGYASDGRRTDDG
jgi:glycosyltransferase involved in cell wall biosynthesis